MEIKHQVFVSSTYKDLIDERKEVIHALLELDCIPAGMELFPATDEDAWSLIKEVIYGCDYYILILAGKYGSTNEEGIGYTEMEYDYALSIGKPILCFLHESIDAISAGKVESSVKAKKQLNAFREKASKKHCKFWSDANDLGGKVSRSLIQLKKRHPSEGWVPGRYAADQKMLSEVERMRARVAELEMQVLVSNDGPPQNIEELMHGDDVYGISISLKKEADGNREKITVEASWDKIFSYCGAALVGECTSEELLDKVHLAFWHSVPDDIQDYNSHEDVIIPYVVEDTIRIQLQALGLISHGTKKRAVSDSHTYWQLTPYGEKYLIQISALKKAP